MGPPRACRDDVEKSWEVRRMGTLQGSVLSRVPRGTPELGNGGSGSATPPPGGHRQYTTHTAKRLHTRGDSLLTFRNSSFPFNAAFIPTVVTAVDHIDTVISRPRKNHRPRCLNRRRRR